MIDWNVVATTKDASYRAAQRVLHRFGRVERTNYRGVLVMNVPDLAQFLQDLDSKFESDPGLAQMLGRVVPVVETFHFQTQEEFEGRSKEIVLRWVPRLSNKSFHVRMHRRGFKGRLVRPVEERFLDEALLEALERAGTPGRIDFEDPDAVIVVETVDTRAGLSLWMRDDLRLHRFLRVD